MSHGNYNMQSSSSGNRKSQSYNKYGQFGNEIQNKMRAPENQYDYGDRNEYQKTSVKVHHAPGGKSSINVFGDNEPKTNWPSQSAGGRRKA